MFSWLKRLAPRGIYARAALILILPVLVVQLVVSSVFIQRHYENVTEQMALALSYDLNLILDRFAREGAQAGLSTADALEVEVQIPSRAETGQASDRRAFYDLSGTVMTEIFRDRLPDVRAVDLLENHRLAIISVGAGAGRPAMDLTVSRQRVSASNPHQLLVIMVSTGILMTGLAYLFLRNQLRPIRRLAAAAEAFGKGRMVPYHPGGANEVRSAGRAFLDMRARIESQIEQRTMMLSGVSHDLRTPLTRMRLGLSMLDGGPDIADIERDVDEMEGLLDTFLDFARGEALDDPSESDPAALAQEVVEAARRGGGEIEYDGPDEAVPVQMRPKAVQRALSNLVSNALRYGRRAVVSVTLLDSALRFSVEDDGPGIPPESRGDAVLPFLRLDTARNQDRGSGVGLGLAIANDIARRHGGTLRLGESARLGGLRVDLVLPR
ncbi:ATP-binding protein [Roseibacterium sp. SDUM158017]|uniref:ATP-binding protein n=1 Tax=Roseicyclus salinarum TaxID=3036773 RepID=UPI0024156A59|nr:ATP-binding protein [Roseibacterium sp. SDUM158017]MDG4647535.1 ATP-binding protein [Roseibacterium sp. SDUM158017]